MGGYHLRWVSSEQDNGDEGASSEARGGYGAMLRKCGRHCHVGAAHGTVGHVRWEWQRGFQRGQPHPVSRLEVWVTWHLEASAVRADSPCRPPSLRASRVYPPRPYADTQ